MSGVPEPLLLPPVGDGPDLTQNGALPSKEMSLANPYSYTK